MINVRRSVFDALVTMEQNNSYSNIVLDSAVSKMDSRDRAFFTVLFYGVIAKKIQLSYILTQYSTKPFNKLSINVRVALMLGLYQIMYVNSVPASAAVNESVNIIKSVGESSASGFVNGILRSIDRMKAKYDEPKDKQLALSIKYSVPMSLISLWRKSYGHEKTMEILENLDTVPALFLTVNTTKIKPDLFLENLIKTGVDATLCTNFGGKEIKNCVKVRNSGDVTRLYGFDEGLFHVQDISSVLCANSMPVSKNMRILDVCSAPGGKAFTICENMSDTGEIVACDIHKHRVKLINDGAKRLGLQSIKASVQDALVYNENLGMFDAVLCDALCSGFGIIRRKPEIRYKDIKECEKIVQIQKDIAENCLKYLKKGGTMLYSTCTLNPQENENVVEYLRDKYNNLKLLEMHTILPSDMGNDGFFYTVFKYE